MMSKVLAANFTLAVLGATLWGQAPAERIVAQRHPTLFERVRQGDADAVLELGRSGDPLAIPYLQVLAAQPRREYGTIPGSAQMALARLGVSEHWKEIARELQSADPLVQDQAVAKFAYVGTREAVEGLLALLDLREYRTSKQHPNDDPRREGTLVFSPLFRVALRWLPKAVPDPPESLRYAEEDVQVAIWRQWWKAYPRSRR